MDDRFRIRKEKEQEEDGGRNMIRMEEGTG